MPRPEEIASLRIVWCLGRAVVSYLHGGLLDEDERDSLIDFVEAGCGGLWWAGDALGVHLAAPITPPHLPSHRSRHLSAPHLRASFMLRQHERLLARSRRLSAMIQ